MFKFNETFINTIIYYISIILKLIVNIILPIITTIYFILMLQGNTSLVPNFISNYMHIGPANNGTIVMIILIISFIITTFKVEKYIFDH